MGYRFRIIKRVLENEALIAFIDLLGTRKLYENIPTEKQAKKILYGLLSRFDIKFAQRFKGIEQNFDVSIFSDSILISERKTTLRIIEKLVEFLLCYQADLFLYLDLLSRAVVIKDSFFSLKMTDPSPESILGSPYTSVSLFGGKSVKAEDYLKGLPMGVYVSRAIEKDLSAEQKKRVVAIRNDKNLVFIKQKHDIVHFLPDKYEMTFVLLNRRPNADNKAILDSLKACDSDKDRLKKLKPWVLVHRGKQKQIIKCNKALKRDAPKSGCSP
jgi:hypothetical protein